MRRLLLLFPLLLWHPASGQNTSSDSLSQRLLRLGYFLDSDPNDGPPYTAFKLNADGSLSVRRDMPIYFLDGAGRPLPGGPHEYGTGPFRQGRAIVFRGGRAGVINAQGEVIVPLVYEYLQDICHPHGWTAARTKQLWGLVDSLGRETVPPRYQDINQYSEGLLAVQRNGKWGFIDLAGQEVISPAYESVHGAFHNGFALVQQSGQRGLQGYGFIDRRGQVVTPFEYPIPFCMLSRHYRTITPFYTFDRGFAIVGNPDCRQGVVDTTGRLVLPVRFDYIERTDSTLVGHYRRRKTVVYRIPR